MSDPFAIDQGAESPPDAMTGAGRSAALAAGPVGEAHTRIDRHASDRRPEERDPIDGEPLVVTPTGMDWWLLAAFIGLATVGVVMAFSASMYDAVHGHHGDELHFLHRHLAYACVSLVALFVGLVVPYRLWARLAWPSLIATIGLLIAVLLFGETVNRATRWLDFKFFRFQPAELAKLVFALYLAWSLSKKAGRGAIRTFSVGLAPHFLVWVIVFGLCMRQPDLGTGIVLAILLFAMTFVAGTNVAYLVFIGLSGAFGLGWFLIHDPMRSRRITAFLEPLVNRQDSAYQLFNGKLAIATGGFLGQGLGASRQKLGFIPEAHTDFVLSVIGEELGILGLALVAVLFGVIMWRGLRIARGARCEFGRLLAIGLTTLFGTHAAINYGVVMGLLPTKGLTLPFISYGGSSLAVMALSAGILLGVGRGHGAILPDGSLDDEAFDDEALDDEALDDEAHDDEAHDDEAHDDEDCGEIGPDLTPGALAPPASTPLGGVA